MTLPADTERWKQNRLSICKKNSTFQCIFSISKQSKVFIIKKNIFIPKRTINSCRKNEAVLLIFKNLFILTHRTQSKLKKKSIGRNVVDTTYFSFLSSIFKLCYLHLQKNVIYLNDIKKTCQKILCYKKSNNSRQSSLYKRQ